VAAAAPGGSVLLALLLPYSRLPPVSPTPRGGGAGEGQGPRGACARGVCGAYAYAPAPKRVGQNRACGRTALPELRACAAAAAALR
jgi:hypothetical protein